MKERIYEIIKDACGEGVAFDVLLPEKEGFGHYATNVALKLAKEERKKPLEVAAELTSRVKEKAPKGFFEKIETAPPGFINFWLTREAWTSAFAKLASDKHCGVAQDMKGKTVMVEFTDPNPFKLFHIGHLMSNTIGESFSRLYSAAGAKVLRANYQGDVGLHVAMSVWGMMKTLSQLPADGAPLSEKVAYLGAAYAAGSRAHRGGQEKEKAEIEALNRKIYERSDAEVNALYDKGRAWSLEYFEEVYRRLGTKFAHYFFESEVGAEGKELVLKHKGDVFEESDGAIVFRGEKYELHTRVFLNSKGLPTYEAKELGLNKKKFELYRPNLSIIVTGNEITEYFKVLKKAMELILPEVAEKTRHVPHGMLRLPSGKMSSRTGDVVTAESLIKEVKEKLKERESERGGLSEKEREVVREEIAVGAIKYSILKQHPGQDIVFDFERSLSVQGDSGPYLQYTYARLKSILRKAADAGYASGNDIKALDSDVEAALVRKIVQFPDVVELCVEHLASSHLAKYLFELANLANRFYEGTPVLKEENASRRAARIFLAAAAANVLERGLGLLGMKAPEKI
jgi:arginyl-tRNA synthetase